MDNVSFHKTARIAKWFADNQQNVHYLPTYSPFLNPCEHLFSKVKGELAGDMGDRLEAIHERVATAAGNVTRNDVRGWLRHCNRYMNACLNRIPVFVDVPNDQVFNQDDLYVHVINDAVPLFEAELA